MALTSPDRAGGTFLRPLLSTLRFIATHPVSSRRPLAGFWRYGRWQIESRLRPEVEFTWIEGSKLIVRNGMAGATGNIYCGLHEFSDMAFLLHLLRPDDLFIDVGANVGSYSVLASAVCGACAIAVEPDPDTMRSLRRNIEANGIGHRVAFVEAALGATPGTARFTVGLDTTNRIAPPGDAGTREVRVKTLDEIARGQHPVLVKLDVEGHEAMVLEGGRDTLRHPSLLAVQVETAGEAVRDHLESAGFRRSVYAPFARKLSLLTDQGPAGSPNS